MKAKSFLPKGNESPCSSPGEHSSSLMIMALPEGPTIEIQASVVFKIGALDASHPCQAQVPMLEIQCAALAGVWQMLTGCSLKVSGKLCPCHF